MQDNLPSPFELQVVIPVYNEQSAIGSVIDQWCAQLDASAVRFSIMAIDDGSTDNTAQVLESLQSKWGPKLELVRQKNAGHGPAILKGYQMAVERRVPWVFQIDSDGQCDPVYFPQLWKERENYDLITGYRARRDDGFGRVIISFVLRTVIFLISGVNCRDANVPYRLMRTEAIAPLVQKIPPKFFFTNVGISVLALRAKLRYKYIPIRFRVRHSGETTVPYRKMGRHAVNLYKNLRELLRNP
jgi:dolichol-phosphate mannosyltransferase